MIVEVRAGRGGRQVLTILAEVPGGERTIRRTVAVGRELSPGAHVPLRYARRDPSRIEVDLEALRAGPSDTA